MVIFPLSWPGKIVLILIALMLGFIFWMMMSPERAKKWFGKKEKKN
jgi:hypothetical protein